MPTVLESVPATDPVNVLEQKNIFNKIFESNRSHPGATMVILHEAQSQIGYISQPMQAYIARELKVPATAIHGVVSFYSFFTTKPKGKHTIKFYMGTACYVGGNPQLIEKAKQTLGIGPGETTEDGLITLKVCRWVGACSQAPVVVVNEESHGRVKPNKFPQLINICQE